MNENPRIGHGFFQEIPFDHNQIAEVLHARAERPSPKEIQELAAIGIDAIRENYWNILIYNGLRRLEAWLVLFPEKKRVHFHTRAITQVQKAVVVEELTPSGFPPILHVGMDPDGQVKDLDVEWNFLKLTRITEVQMLNNFGHVRFISQREDVDIMLDVWSDGRHNMLTLDK
jgi:hypothetical protein